MTHNACLVPSPTTPQSPQPSSPHSEGGKATRLESVDTGEGGTQLSAFASAMSFIAEEEKLRETIQIGKERKMKNRGSEGGKRKVASLISR